MCLCTEWNQARAVSIGLTPVESYVHHSPTQGNCAILLKDQAPISGLSFLLANQADSPLCASAGRVPAVHTVPCLFLQLSIHSQGRTGALLSCTHGWPSTVCPPSPRVCESS